MFETIYYNLGENGKLRKDEYKFGSELHRHHIIPTHSDGPDTEDNITYLTIREHVIAHFLLWKLHKNPNDLRSMYMLGAKLTSQQRSVIGKFCKDNKLGFFAYDKNTREDWRRKGVKTSKRLQIGIHDPIKHKEYASMGGKIGARVQIENGLGIHADAQTRSSWASLGGKSHSNKKWINNGIIRTRVHKDLLQEYLDLGWKLGSKLYEF